MVCFHSTIWLWFGCWFGLGWYVAMVTEILPPNQPFSKHKYNNATYLPDMALGTYSLFCFFLSIDGFMEEWVIDVDWVMVVVATGMSILLSGSQKYLLRLHVCS